MCNASFRSVYLYFIHCSSTYEPIVYRVRVCMCAFLRRNVKNAHKQWPHTHNSIELASDSVIARKTKAIRIILDERLCVRVWLMVFDKADGSSSRSTFNISRVRFLFVMHRTRPDCACRVEHTQKSSTKNWRISDKNFRRQSLRHVFKVRATALVHKPTNWFSTP